mmetsp:Transcript_4979/g.15714  ORF Transcript_4979/g.15714 Transcript_4979/m.15714 type:complete len:373 (-) Transcript_4979:567-1685(-)
MLCFPVALYTQQNGYSEGIVFFTSLFAIAPFAERLSFVTEQLALHTSEALGGLLNATFGNVTELIVSFFALRAGLLRIVQVSLLGSILSNLLLVLGCAFFAGGIRHKHQHFNSHGSAVNVGLLMLSVMSLLFPMLLESSHQVLAEGAVLAVSRSVSCLLLILYACYIYFQMHTHAHLYEAGDEERGLTKSVEGEEDGEDEENEEEAVLGVAGAIIWLTVITVVIALLSEYMVDALEGAAEGWGVPDLFLGTIIIPIVGNAAEHAAAIIFAVKNKMELAIGIAVGSSIQIALFCVPVLVLSAWFLDTPLSLNFQPFETGVLLVTIILVGFTILNGESSWLIGVMLVVAYCSLSAAFFVHVDPPEVLERYVIAG